MTPEIRYLLTDLARLNTDLVPLVMAMMDDAASQAEIHRFGDRMAELANRLRSPHNSPVIIDQHPSEDLTNTRRS